MHTIPKLMQLVVFVLYLRHEEWRIQDHYLWTTLTADFCIALIFNIYGFIVLLLELIMFQKEKNKTQIEANPSNDLNQKSEELKVVDAEYVDKDKGGKSEDIPPSTASPINADADDDPKAKDEVKDFINHITSGNEDN